MRQNVLLVLRWSARVTGLALVGFFLFMVAGHGGLPNIIEQPAPVQVQFAGFFFCLAGCLLGWKRELWGGLLAAGGMAAFCATQLIVNGRFPGGVIPVFFVPALLFLASAAFATSSARRGSAG